LRAQATKLDRLAAVPLNVCQDHPRSLQVRAISAAFITSPRWQI
jgi:hypothetical protein